MENYDDLCDNGAMIIDQLARSYVDYTYSDQAAYLIDLIKKC